MANLNDLIRDVQEHEAIDLPGSMNDAMQWRVEEKVLNAMQGEKIVPFKKASRKKWFVLAVAAILIMGLGLTSAAKNEWDIALINFMGLSDANTLQLEGGEVQIDQSAVASGITFTVVSSIGDKNSGYIRIETDYEFPENYNFETDYILPWSHSLLISDGKDYNTKDYASTWMYYVEEGKLCFLVSVSNCEDLNKSRVQLKIKDLYIFHDLNNPESDVEEELLVEGEWSFEWTYHYKSNANVYHMMKSFECNDITYYLTKVEISPISVRIEAFCMPQNRNYMRLFDLIQKITYEDGTFVEIPRESVGSVRDGMFVESFVDLVELGEVLKSDEVKSITISGTEIDLK